MTDPRNGILIWKIFENVLASSIESESEPTHGVLVTRGVETKVVARLERVVERGRGEAVTHKASLPVAAVAVSVAAFIENAVCGVSLRQDRHVVARGRDSIRFCAVKHTT